MGEAKEVGEEEEIAVDVKPHGTVQNLPATLFQLPPSYPHSSSSQSYRSLASALMSRKQPPNRPPPQPQSNPKRQPAVPRPPPGPTPRVGKGGGGRPGQRPPVACGSGDEKCRDSVQWLDGTQQLGELLGPGVVVAFGDRSSKDFFPAAD